MSFGGVSVLWLKDKLKFFDDVEEIGKSATLLHFLTSQETLEDPFCKPTECRRKGAWYILRVV